MRDMWNSDVLEEREGSQAVSEISERERKRKRES